MEQTHENTEILRGHETHGRFSLLRNGNAEEKQTETSPNNYCNWSPSYRSVNEWRTN